MLATNILCCKDRDEWSRRGRFFHVGTALGLLALHQAHHAGDFKTEIKGGFDGLNGRGASGANVIDDYNPRALLAEAFDALPRAMLLFSLANQEALQIAANHGNGSDNGIGAHGEATDGLRLPPFLANFVAKNLAGQPRALGIEG